VLSFQVTFASGIRCGRYLAALRKLNVGIETGEHIRNVNCNRLKLTSVLKGLGGKLLDLPCERSLHLLMLGVWSQVTTRIRFQTIFNSSLKGFHTDVLPFFSLQEGV